MPRLRGSGAHALEAAGRLHPRSTVSDDAKVQPDALAYAARELGARGSRDEVGEADPSTRPSPPAQALLRAAQPWWESRARGAGLSGPWLDVHQAIDQDPPTWWWTEANISNTVLPDLGRIAGWGAHQLGQGYVDALEAGVRARHGRHYTPQALAEELWAMTRRALGRRAPAAMPLEGLTRDPASGTGALLLPALREHISARLTARAEPRMVLAALPNQLEAIDTDPAAIWLANVLLAAEALPVLAQVPPAQRRPLPALARVGDGLDPDLRPARTVLMNPPYGRVRLGTADRERFASTLYGHANLYGLFLAAGLESLADSTSVLSALVPTSFTAGLYFRNLRGKLSASAALTEAAFVADRGEVFAGVLQETCLATFTRRRARRTTVSSINGTTTPVAKVPTPRGKGPWLLPRHAIDAGPAAAAAAMSTTLGEAGWKASTGPLVWNRRRDDLASDPTPQRAPIIWAADLDGQRLHRDPARDAMRYLTLRKPSDSSVMVLAEPAVLVQRTTAPEQRRRLVGVEFTSSDLAAWGGRVVVENHVNVLRPRPGHDGPLTHSLLNRLLASDTLDRVMRCMSGSVAVSAYELESLPLPSPDVLAKWAAILEAEPEADLGPLVAHAYRAAGT